MAERTIALVLKTSGPHGPGGSNPPPSATLTAARGGRPAITQHAPGPHSIHQGERSQIQDAEVLLEVADVDEAHAVSTLGGHSVVIR